MIRLHVPAHVRPVLSREENKPDLDSNAPCPTMSDARIHLRMRFLKLMCVKIRAMP